MNYLKIFKRIHSTNSYRYSSQLYKKNKIVTDELFRMSKEKQPYETQIRTAVRENKNYIYIENSPELCEWDLINDDYTPSKDFVSDLQRHFKIVDFTGLKGYKERYKCYFN